MPLKYHRLKEAAVRWVWHDGRGLGNSVLPCEGEKHS